MNTLSKSMVFVFVCFLIASPLATKQGQCFLINNAKIDHKECLCQCDQEEKFSSGKCKRCGHFREPLKLIMDMRKFKLHQSKQA
jgi:hypothetical protein